jgi:hypothetical protein
MREEDMMLKSVGIGVALTLALLVGRVDTAGAVGVGKTCGGIAGIACDAGLFCDHKPHECRIIDAAGKCVQIPFVCPLTQSSVGLQVCGCNGTTYWDDCERVKAMAQKNHNGPCK